MASEIRADVRFKRGETVTHRIDRSKVGHVTGILVGGDVMYEVEWAHGTSSNYYHFQIQRATKEDVARAVKASLDIDSGDAPVE